MKRIITFIIFVLLAAVSTQARSSGGGPVVMTLQPASTENTDKYRLLPAPAEQKDEDAAPLYAKAVQLLPKDLPADQINKWREMAMSDLPIDQIAATVEKVKPSLQLVEQAAKCKKCGSVESQNLQQYRQLALALALQSRLLTAQSKYEQAVDTIGTGLVMARHIAESSSLIQGLVGNAIAAVMCKQVEKIIQAPGSPNLYRALRDLPKPFIDLNSQIESEAEDTKEKIRLLMNRLDRHVAVLQCIEAIRHFAATHDSKLPENLAAITGMALPEDPVTGKPFIYKLSDAVATLEGPMAKGGTEKDMVRYELKLNP